MLRQKLSPRLCRNHQPRLLVCRLYKPHSIGAPEVKKIDIIKQSLEYFYDDVWLINRLHWSTFNNVNCDGSKFCIKIFMTCVDEMPAAAW